jgi:hypothetical protein
MQRLGLPVSKKITHSLVDALLDGLVWGRYDAIEVAV